MASTGIVVSRRDAGAITEALARLASGSGLARDMGAAGRRACSVAHSDSTDQIAAFSALYERVLALSLANDGAR